MNHLLDRITSAAWQRFTVLYNGEADRLESEWFEMWFDTASEMRVNFVLEGLHETVAELDKIVEQQRAVVMRYQAA